MSKNNVVSTTYTSKNYTYTDEIEYTYEGKLPATKTLKRNSKTFANDHHITSVSSTETWYYEYQE